ncbi:hypothetical protein PUNSTDRAFT_137252 [Punctularia strigosozonata HHB-11173 SS5]|uniref:uncharacterized protein n=1 Tax=Punctularia strigosozonata (strain HHB-11173) TaxID=741275 RepID=UPI00044186FE|nr:uncharacterized protein PUNSTDRAFT_137252 [Punctularia strigosozonata HHB-11173 SS5]EIN05760.1 hypothetical protein PUNSTDRAFT_137252 [Punctularia strigosozonata HHB-11173 SS5]
MTCRVLNNICELYFYKRGNLVGLSKITTFADFLATPEGMHHPTIHWLLFDIQSPLKAIRTTHWTSNGPEYKSYLMRCAEKMLGLLAGKYAQVPKLQLFDQGECLGREPRLAGAIVNMHHLVDFAMSRSSHGMGLLRCMSQPLRSLQIGKPGGVPYTLQPPTPRTLDDISLFAQSLETLALEESYLSSLQYTGTFPRLRYLRTTYIPGQSQPVQWTHINTTFPALRYMIYVKEDQGPDIGVEHSRVYNEAMDYASEDQSLGLSLRTDCDGVERIRKTLDVRELIMVGELGTTTIDFLVRPSVFCWFQHNIEYARKTLEFVTRSVSSLNVILFGSLAAVPNTHALSFSGLCKGSMTDIGYLLHLLPIVGLNLRVDSSMVNDGTAAAALHPSSIPAETYAKKLLGLIPGLKRINLYILGSEEPQPISWIAEDRILRRVSAEDGRVWREAQASNFLA